MSGIGLSRADVDGVPILSLAGALSYRNAPSVMNAVAVLLSGASRHAAVVDVAGLTGPLSGSLLMLFPEVLAQCGGWPAVSLHLAAPSAGLARVLDAQRVARYLPVHATTAAALLSAERDGQGHVAQVTLPATPGSVRSARQSVQDMWSACPESRLEDALLVVSELATNAVEHVGEDFTVTVSCTPACGLIAVSDVGRGEPVVGASLLGTERGTGMRLVVDLSQSWGVRLRMPRGKTVWAELDRWD